VEITEVRVFPVNEDKLKAYATITFDHCFVVRDLKVIQGNSGLFVAMPSKKRKDGTFKDTAHPLNTETREMIEAKVLAEYRKELERAGSPAPDVGDRKLSPKADEPASETPSEAPAEEDGE
jgi:stage V sporulation protein G